MFAVAAYDDLKQRLGEINDLHSTAAILDWDQNVMMPARGSAIRAEQLATLGKLAHEMFVDDETGRLLDAAAPFAEAQPYDSVEASLVRVTRRDWEKARKIPAELTAEMTRQASLAIPVWVEARRNSDYKAFRPALQTNLDLRKRYVECFAGEFDEPYDVLLDDFEPGMRTAEVRRLFDYLKEHQAPLVRRAAEAAAGVAPPTGPWAIDAQKVFELEVARAFGFDDDAWRLDPTVHPFATGAGSQDIRITTRYFPDHLGGLFGTMHETGHGLYEHQVGAELERTPLGSGVSLGFHESQSRMWENLVGRGRPFWRHFFPRLAELFPEATAGLDPESWYRVMNTVEPSLIRVEADEATYNLHIILRFELEQAMINGTVSLDDLPGEWNRLMSEYLTVDVPDDANGVLQDTHWAGGAIGYFPTYALGNLIGAQIWSKIEADLPDLDASFAAGDFAPLRVWLRDNLHTFGRKYTPAETLERVVGTRTIDPAPYVAYLQSKLSDLYGV